MQAARSSCNTARDSVAASRVAGARARAAAFARYFASLQRDMGPTQLFL
jgi:hypothetical protein